MVRTPGWRARSLLHISRFFYFFGRGPLTRYTQKKSTLLSQKKYEPISINDFLGGRALADALAACWRSSVRLALASRRHSGARRSGTNRRHKPAAGPRSEEQEAIRLALASRRHSSTRGRSLMRNNNGLLFPPPSRSSSVAPESKIRGDTGRYGEIRGDTGRYGEIWSARSNALRRSVREPVQLQL